MNYDLFSSFKKEKELIHGFTHRNGGVAETSFGSQHMGILSGVETDAAWENIKALTKSFELPVKAIVMTAQIHKDSIESFYLDNAQLTYRDDFAFSVLKDTDGVFTNEKSILLMTFYADCTPIYFYDAQKSVIGMVHSGWRGTAQRIAVKGIAHMMNQYQSNLKDIKVVIGPSASGCCYEVDDFVKDHFKQDDAFFTPTTSGHYKMDLKGINRKMLLACGLNDEQVEVSAHCTLCETQTYFSYRNEAGKTGRMAAFMMLAPQV